MFSNQKGTDSGIVHKVLNIAPNKSIERDNGLGDLNIFLGGQSPGIEICKLFVWEGGNSGYIHIKICIESTKVRVMIMKENT